MQEKQKQQQKELKESMQQRKLAVDDFTDMNEKYVPLASINL